MTITYEGATDQTRQIIHHHAVLRRGLERRVGALCEAVESGVPFERQMTMLRDYLAGEIFPHAQAEERTVPGGGHPGARQRPRPRADRRASPTGLPHRPAPGGRGLAARPPRSRNGS